MNGSDIERLIAELRSWKSSEKRDAFAELLSRALRADRKKTIAAIKGTFTFPESAVPEMAEGRWVPSADIQEYIIHLVAESFEKREGE